MIQLSGKARSALLATTVLAATFQPTTPAAALAQSVPAAAPESAEGANFGDIIVTAQKREENL